MKKQIIIIDSKNYSIEILEEGPGTVCFKFKEETYRFDLKRRAGEVLVIHSEADQENFMASLGEENRVYVGEMSAGVGWEAKRKGRRSGSGPGDAVALEGPVSPMPGRIFKILKRTGDLVVKGEVIILMEAMKMEYAVRADRDGVLEEIFHREQEVVPKGVLLVKIGPKPS